MSRQQELAAQVLSKPGSHMIVVGSGSNTVIVAGKSSVVREIKKFLDERKKKHGAMRDSEE